MPSADNALYAELDRLKAEVKGLRELCQKQDQDIQRLSRWRDRWKAMAKSLYYYESPTMRRADRLLRKQNHDDWPMEYDPQVLLEASEVMHAKSRLREAIPDEREQLKAQIAELTKERDHYEDRCEQLYPKIEELERKLATCTCETRLLNETWLIERDRLLARYRRSHNGIPCRACMCEICVATDKLLKVKP